MLGYNDDIFKIFKQLIQLIRKLFGILIIAAICIILLIDSREKIIDNLKLYNSLSPILSFTQKLINFLDRNISFLSEFVHYKNNNELLRQQVEELERKVAELKFQAAENESLKELLHYKSNLPAQYVTARVIASSKSPYSNSLIIDIGSKGGINKGDIVVNHLAMIGIIAEIEENTAKIRSITDSKSNIPVISEYKHIRAIASGNGGNLLPLTYLAEGNKLHIGELLFTSGDDGHVPAGLLVGIVKENDRGKTIAIPAVDWNKLFFVKVISKKL